MRKFYILLLTITGVYMTSCSNSPTDKAQSSVNSYLKENLKNSASYEHISFSRLDTLKKADTSETKQISLYKITNNYSIVNSDKDKVKMTVTFYLDKDLKVNEPNTKSINGDYGALTGNVYWKYNDYVGNKADAGAEITMYTIDTIRGNLKYESSADVQGNYKFEKVLPGSYFIIVCSKNATDCPLSHLRNLEIYSSTIKQLFGFNLDNYKISLNEINKLDSIFEEILLDPDVNKYGGISSKIDKYSAIEKEMREKAENLIDTFPEEFKTKIKFFTGYSNAYDFSIIRIEEGKTKNENTDFGITCI